MIERMKKVMSDNDWSYQRVANSYGCCMSTVTKWMAGKYQPKADFIIWFCKKFHVSADWLPGLEER